jgi:hypothetical protein
MKEKRKKNTRRDEWKVQENIHNLIIMTYFQRNFAVLQPQYSFFFGLMSINFNANDQSLHVTLVV